MNTTRITSVEQSTIEVILLIYKGEITHGS